MRTLKGMISDIRILLPDIRSAHNVGSIFRTADAAGVSHIYVTGTSPRPIDRFGRKRKDIAKVSLGAEDTVAWEYHEDVQILLEDLRKKGYTIIAVEQDERSKNYHEITYTGDVLFIFGNEVQGIDPQIVGYADHIAEIPMYGDKESLNVSVTAGIMLFHARQSLIK